MIEELQMHIERVENICQLIENREEYNEELMGYVGALDTMINDILACSHNQEIPFFINEEFVLQVLKDIIYGIENKDSVFLLDTLRYGLLEIYYYTVEELQSGE